MPDARAVAVAIAGICAFLNLYTPQAILPDLAASFHAPITQASLTITLPLLAVAFVAPFVGSISDRAGRKRLIVTACAALAVPTLLIAAVDSLAMMQALRFVQGLLLPFVFAVTVAYIGDECPGDAGIRTAASYATGTVFGGFAGRFVAGIAAELGGWRMAFVVIGLLSLAGAAAVAILLPLERNFRASTGGLRATLATYAEHLRNPRLLATCGIGFGMLFCMVAMFTYANLYLAAPPYGLGPGQLGFVFVVNLLGLVTNPVATRLVLRVGRRATLALVVTLSTAGLLLTLSPLLPAVIAGMAATGGGLFVVQTLSLGFIAATIPRAKSTAVGLYVTCYYVGGALGGSVPALVWTRMGWPGVVGLLLPLLAAILALAWIFWREPRPGNVGFISR